MDYTNAERMENYTALADAAFRLRWMADEVAYIDRAKAAEMVALAEWAEAKAEEMAA